MAQVEMDMVEEVAMEVEVVAAMEAEAVVDTVEEIEEVEEDTEVVVDIKAEVAAAVGVDTEALAMTTGAMMEVWEEAGDLVETVEAWTTTEVLPNSIILSPFNMVCAMAATAMLTLPLLPLHISKSPSHTDLNLLNSMLLSIKHGTTTIVLSTLLT